MLAPYLGVGLLGLGLPIHAIFVMSIVLIAIGWVMFGRVQAPAPTQPASLTRYRWPIRFRWPWL
jgi:hypothetical protein